MAGGCSLENSCALHAVPVHSVPSLTPTQRLQPVSKKRKPTRLQALEAQVLWLTQQNIARKETSIAIWDAIDNTTTDVEIGDIVERLNELGNRCDSFLGDPIPTIMGRQK